MKQPKSTGAKKDNPVGTWDLTIYHESSPANVAAALRPLAGAWVFQQERGSESGTLHFQVRLRLFHKLTKSAFIALIKDNVTLRGAHLSKTSGVNSKKFNYVMKLDSRVDGPWCDTDPDPEDFDPETFYEPLPWQKEAIDYVKGPIDSRKIRVYVDTTGGIGKSTLISMLRFKKLATIIPPTMEKAEDIAAMVMCKSPDRAYVVDLSRAINPSKMGSFWAGLESIKNGYCSDKRHKFRDRVFKKPHLLVFTNKEPSLEMMSNDRWDIVRPSLPVVVP
jgi:hypothetical protein